MTSLIDTIDVNLTFNKNTVRIYGTFEEPLFVVKDICDILGLTNPTETLRNVDTEYQHSVQLRAGSSTGVQTANVVKEPGLYQIIMRCRKPIAKPFQKWVCGEVLPILRKKGEYRMNEEYQLKLTAIENEKKKLEEEKDYAEHLLKQKEEHIKKLQRETQVVDGKNVVYLCTTDDQEPKGVFTVGKAINLKNRLQAYNNNKLHNFKVVKYISCKSARLMDCIEQMILHKLNKYKIFSNRDVFQLLDGKDVYFFTQWFDYLNKMCEDIEDDIVIEDRPDEEEHELLNEKKEDCKEDKSIYNKEYREEHHEDILEREAYFRTVNKEILRERVSDYRFNNRDKINENQRIKAQNEDAKKKKAEYMAVYRKENAEKIAESKKKYNEEHKNAMEAKIKCACGSTVSMQNMTTHLGTDRHKKYLETNMTVDELRKEDYVVCMCGVSISKRSLKRHEKSKLHQSFVESQKCL
jgi:prophage antirepressor-like protein